jgi:hypothetical protein
VDRVCCTWDAEAVVVVDVFSWVAVLSAFAVLGVAFAVPSTRPYARKYWWLLVALGLGALGFVLLRRRAGNKIDGQLEEGRDIAARNTAELDDLVDIALEQAAVADADLARRRLETEYERKRFDAQVEATKLTSDSLERRKALIKLVESQS